MKKDVLSIADLTGREVLEILELTERIKKDKASYGTALKGKSLGLVFQKPSNRTRVSFEIGMVQLGGYAIYLGSSELVMGVRESIKDIACVLSRYIDGIVARTNRHEDVEQIATYATVPVINGLSDLEHPCQALCDIYTIKEKFGSFKKIRLAYIGDGNNVLNSLLMASAKVGLAIAVATPRGYEPAKRVVDTALEACAESGGRIAFYHNAADAARGADVIYTDVWVSMGQEKEMKKRTKAFKGFQVNDRILKLAKDECVVMHCLPAHRGQEITDSVIDSPNSIVYDQAENRLHTEKAVLLMLLK